MIHEHTDTVRHRAVTRKLGINSNADDTDVEMVCVTTSGDGYHLPDCQYVRDQ